ncbi:MAG: tetratricopeptide repeat protein [Planctomycetota bacterium]
MEPLEPINTTPDPTETGRHYARWLPLLVIAAGVAVYLNSFSGAFVFDDIRNIVDDKRIRRLWPLWGSTPASRPLVSLSLAVNYALGELNVWGYHAVNLGVHLLAALTLFGIVRRTLSHEALCETYRGEAPWLALTVALIWVVHPLQTESVTYVIQRAESMMGLFYLLTLYCVICGADSLRGWGWYVAAVVCCAMGMGSKGIMVTAPMVMLLYDRAFLSSSFGQILRWRWGLYAGLAATWGILAAVGVFRGVLAPPGEAAAAVGFGIKGITPLQYALAQPGVVLHYLQLSFWPRPLCLWYWRPLAQTKLAVMGPGLVIGGLLVATVWAFRKHSPLGFVGAWFFLILAPTSSIVPIKDLAFEHRMYLPLAAVVVLAVFGVRWALEYASGRLSWAARVRRGIAGGLVLAVAGALGFGTWQRNRDYRSAETVWRDVVAKNPRHAPARFNLANLLVEQHRLDEAIELYEQALTLWPAYPEAHNNLGSALLERGRLDEAVTHFARAVQLRPDYAEACSNFGVALIHKGRTAESVSPLTDALRLKPDYPEAHNYLGVALLAQNKPAEAMQHLAEAVRLRPAYAEARSNLGAAYLSLRQFDQAIAQFSEALRLDPRNVISQINLALALAGQGKLDEAIAAYRHALEIDPNSAPARQYLDEALNQRTARPPYGSE